MIRLTASDATRRHVAEFLQQADALSQPPADALRPLQQVIRATFAANFASESGDGQKWAALAPMTVREREKLGYPGEHPILVRSGDYRRSFTEGEHPQHYSESEIAGGVWRVEEGSTDPRGDQLEYGDFRTPPRPVTRPGARGEGEIAAVLDQLFGDWFEE